MTLKFDYIYTRLSLAADCTYVLSSKMEEEYERVKKLRKNRSPAGY